MQRTTSGRGPRERLRSPRPTVREVVGRAARRAACASNAVERTRTISTPLRSGAAGLVLVAVEDPVTTVTS